MKENINTHIISNRLVDYDISTTTESISTNVKSLEFQFRMYKDLLSDHCLSLMCKFNKDTEHDQLSSITDQTTASSSTTPSVFVDGETSGVESTLFPISQSSILIKRL